MSRLSDEWFKNPNFVREYEALEEEFAQFAASLRAELELPENRSTSTKPVYPELVDGLHYSSCATPERRKKDGPSKSSGKAEKG